MEYLIKAEGEYRYIDEGQGETLLLLHGLFGALSNWAGVINHFKQHYRVILDSASLKAPKKRLSSLY